MVNVFILFLLVGCAGNRQFEAVEQVCVGGLEKPQVMEAAEKVLSRINFKIAKRDDKEGVIITRPLQGGQFFEFWRKDNVGGFNSAEANLHSIRRTAQLSMNKEQGRLCVNCDVFTERLSLFEESETDKALAYDKFSSRRIAMPQKRLQLDTEKKQWVDLGKDLRLSTLILKKLEEQISRSERQNQR